jgi:hypothetical protein
MSRLTTALVLLAGTIAVATAHADPVKVVRNGTTTTLKTGAKQKVITVKNDTGCVASDVCVTIVGKESQEKYDIAGIDIDGTFDNVDDDGDGKPDLGELDNDDSSPGNTCRSIINSESKYVKHCDEKQPPDNCDDEVDLLITFDKDLTEDVEIIVHFSKVVGIVHGELSAVIPVNPETGAGGALLSAGPAQVIPALTTLPGYAVSGFALYTSPENPIVDILFTEEFADSFFLSDGEAVIVELSKPMVGAEVSDFLLVFKGEFTAPQPLEVVATVIPWADEDDCVPDFNDDEILNILDFVAFQGAFQSGDADADVNLDGLNNILDFVTFQDLFIQGCFTGHELLDNFDDYNLGPACDQGGWESWPANPLYCAEVTDQRSRSGQQSLMLIGDSLDPYGDDVVHPVSDVHEGVWSFQAWTFVPAGATGTGWVVLLNTYDPAGPKNWSLALALDATNGLVQENPFGKQDPPTVPLIVDQWVPIDVQVDLDNDSCNVYYDGQLLLAGQSWSAGMNAPGKAAIEALHLDAGDPGTGISAMFIDDVSLTPAK